MAAFQEILDVLPVRYRTLDVSNVQELRLRAGQSPAVVENGAERRLAGLGRQGAGTASACAEAPWSKTVSWLAIRRSALFASVLHAMCAWTARGCFRISPIRA